MYYLHRGGYVYAFVHASVCLSISRIYAEGFQMNFVQSRIIMNYRCRKNKIILG